VTEEVDMSGNGPRPAVLLSGIQFGEQPRWHEGRLWFSDWGPREVIAVDLAGSSEVVVRAPSFPCCADWLPDGRLLVMSGSEGRLLRREADGSLVTHADLNAASRPPAGNELVVDGRGNIYVNGGGFDLMAGAPFAPGVVVLVSPDGSSRVVAGDLAFPNGMLVTSDNATLIVAESYAKRLTAFDIAADGSLSNRRLWADLRGGVPDGICLDDEGAVWYADVPNKRCVRVRQGGEVLRTIVLDRACFACALGGPERRTLFMMATEWKGPGGMFSAPRTGQLLAIEAPAPGVGWP
jgi:sugar lactone lactonase YvrE